VNVAAVVEPSSFLTVRVVELIANSCRLCCMSRIAWASVGATLSAAYDSVSAVVSTAAKFSAAEGTAVVTLLFIVAVRSPDVAAFVRFVTVVIVPAVMFVGVASPDWISVTASVARAAAVTTFAPMLLTAIPDAEVMFVGVANPDWISLTASVASADAVMTFAPILLTAIPLAEVMFVGVAKPDWISLTASVARADAVMTFSPMLLTEIPLAEVMFVGVANPL